MRTRFKLTVAAVTVIACAIGTQARASVLSFSELSASGLNTGTYTLGDPSLTTSTSSLYYSKLNYSQTVSNFSVEAVSPTNTSAGLALDYTKTTTSYFDRVESYMQDSFYTSVSTVGSTIGSGKYLAVTGKVKSSEAIQLNLSLSAEGKYGSSLIPGLGAVPNGSITFFRGIGGPYEAQQTTTAYYIADASFRSSNSGSLSLNANEEVSFAALVYSSDASLSAFTIRGSSGLYGQTVIDTPYLFSEDRLVGSHLLPPVPEPETYAMLLAGLGLLGAIVRRRKLAAAA